MKTSHHSTAFHSIVALLALLALCSAPALAQPTAHYVPGTEGIKGPSLPPPGLYLRDYNVFYTSDRINDNDGDKIKGADLRTTVYAQVPRLVWITDTKFLGGYVGVDALWPVIEQDVKVNTPAGKFDSEHFGLGDPFAEATLSWHLTQFDFSLGLGEWIPAGASAAPPSSKPGLGYWDTMLTAGATWYPDTEKTWALSLLTRYEFNGEQRHTDMTPGQACTLEWGVSKSVLKTVDLGLVGYYQTQVTFDHGHGASDFRDHVAAAGPEISLAFPAVNLFVSLRYCYEFWSESRAQGHTVNLTATYRF